MREIIETAKRMGELNEEQILKIINKIIDAGKLGEIEYYKKT